MFPPSRFRPNVFYFDGFVFYQSRGYYSFVIYVKYTNIENAVKNSKLFDFNKVTHLWNFVNVQQKITCVDKTADNIFI